MFLITVETERRKAAREHRARQKASLASGFVADLSEPGIGDVDYVGPFPQHKDAVDYAKEKFGDRYWYVQSLTTPQGVMLVHGDNATGAFVRIETFTTYATDPPITWDIHTMKQDIEAGKYGEPVTFDTDALPPPDLQNGNIELPKIEYFMKQAVREPGKRIIDKPCIIVGADPAEKGPPWLCVVDGCHRITTRQVLHVQEKKMHAPLHVEHQFDKCRGYIIPFEAEKKYRIEQG